MAKKVILAVVVVVVIMCAAAYLLYEHIQSDNILALAQLNKKIYQDGSNVRYLASNSTLFDQVFNTSVGASNTNFMQAVYNQSSISKLLDENKTGSINGPVSIPSSVDTYDWLQDNQQVRSTVLNELFSQGVPVINRNVVGPSDNLFGGEPQLLVPEQATDLESLYELDSFGQNVLEITKALIWLFSVGSFGNSDIVTQANVSTVGFALSSNPFGQDFGTSTYTNLINSSNAYDDLSVGAETPNGWLMLMAEVSAAHGLPFNLTNAREVFYAMSLTQYDGYQSSEILYNKTIAPSIELVEYDNSTTIINLGNLNLSNTSIALYIDGNATDYARYWNYLVVSNRTLKIGFHKIDVRVNNYTLSTHIYVSPILLSGTVYYAIKGNLGFAIYNPYQSNLTISNLSVTSGLSGVPSVNPQNLSSVIIGSVSNSTNLALINATYNKLNFYKTYRDNYTGRAFTESNYTVTNLSGNSYILNKKGDFIQFLFKVGQKVAVGTPEYFTVTYDTNYGPGRAVIHARAS